MARTVLVVDDDPMFRALATRVLAGQGLSVVGEAGTVAEALVKARELEPSAALVDVGLPDGDGFTLSRELTTMPWRPRVVITSVEADFEASSEFRHSGAEAFVPKADLPSAPFVRLFAVD